MFESEDFDLDEDFLKDIGAKEEEYYSQRIVSESDGGATKRRKIEPIKTDLFSDIKFDDEPDFARIAKNTIEPCPEAANSTGASLRTEIIPKIAKTDDDDEASGIRNVGKIINGPSCASKRLRNVSSSESNENAEISRKKLALEILRKGSETWDARGMEKSSKDLATRTSPPGPISSDVERNPRLCDTREQKREIFEKPINLGRKISRNVGSRERAIDLPRVTLIRKFPGPAGLLPDCPETCLDSANFSNRPNEIKNETNDEHDDSAVSEYFSQETERFFSAGAWRSMLDDLPLNFLQGHEIATIKRTARKKSRISFLAGVIQRIDHSVENPRLVLKDLSDTIEGTMHRDIPLAHPNILEPGVVVLLRNAGVLGFSASPNFPILRYHIMIAPKNLLAVYNEKARLVTSPWMETNFGSVRETEKNEETSGRLKTLPIGHGTMDTRAETIKLPKVSSMVTRNNIDISDFVSDEDDSGFSRFRIADKNGDSHVSTDSSKFSPKRDDNLTKVFSPEDNPTRIIVGADDDDANLTDEIVGRGGGSIDEGKTEISLGTENEARTRKIDCVRSKLMRFRSKDVLTPKIIVRVDETLSSSEKKNYAIPPSEDSMKVDDTRGRGFGDDLLDSDNDTEDEILSQLDVDSIVTSYNSAT